MRFPFPSRLLPIGALATAGVLFGGVSIAFAQLADTPAVVQSSRIDVMAAAIREASLRFGVPEQWIRAVMRVESANDPRAKSSAGAMGLMQVMPATYAGLRRRYGLGADPFEPRDNILAGTAFLREMHDRYGRTGMLAAYNAGPGRWEEHMRGTRRLPLETLNYLARLGPAVGLRSFATASRVPFGRALAVPPSTVFATIGGGVAAAPVSPDEQAEALSLALEPPIESVFASRDRSGPNTSGHAREAGTSPSTDPLFAPVGRVGGGR